MSTLYLLRHARAGWALPGMSDFDRPLDETGTADSQATAIAMRMRAYVPDITLCSNARRCRQTLEAIAEHVDTGRVNFLDTLYSEDAAGYLRIIQENGCHSSVLVIGHNPMMEDLAIAVSGSGEDHVLAALRSGFPTSGLAVIHFDEPLSSAAPGKGRLVDFVTPADL